MGQPVGNTLPARMGNRPQRRFGRRVRVVRRRVFRPSGPVPRRGGRVRRRAQHTGRDPLYPARAPGRMGRQRQRIAADPLRGRCASLPGGDAADTLPGRIAGLVTPTIEISAGGFRTSVQAPAGDDINYPDTKRTSARGLAIEALLPAGTFGAGETSSRSAMPAAAGSSGTPSSSKPTAA